MTSYYCENVFFKLTLHDTIRRAYKAIINREIVLNFLRYKDEWIQRTNLSRFGNSLWRR